MNSSRATPTPSRPTTSKAGVDEDGEVVVVVVVVDDIEDDDDDDVNSDIDSDAR